MNYKFAAKNVLITIDVVIVNPTGPTYVPINTSLNITCHYEREIIFGWSIAINNGSATSFNLIKAEVSNISGITGRYLNGIMSSIVISVNISESSMLEITCIGIGGGAMRYESTTHILFYGKFIFMGISLFHSYILLVYEKMCVRLLGFACLV